jgi:argininosuccinate synthase
MENKKLVLAFSGGLDTTYCAIYLSKIEGYEVHAACVNTGGFSEEEIDKIKTHLMYNKNKWYHRTSSRYSWKEIIDNDKLYSLFNKYLKLSKDDIENDEVMYQYKSMFNSMTSD